MSFEVEGGDGAAAIRTVLADGDPLARRTVRDALQRGGITVVAEATTGTEAVELSTFYRPDAVVMDVKLPGIGGIDATRIIHERSPETCVVLLAEEDDAALGLRAIRAGATGYLSRAVEPDVLPRVLRGALEGEAAISRRLAGELVESYRRAPRGGGRAAAGPQHADRPRVGGPGPGRGRRRHRGDRADARAVDRDRALAPEEPLPQARRALARRGGGSGAKAARPRRLTRARRAWRGYTSLRPAGRSVRPARVSGPPERRHRHVRHRRLCRTSARAGGSPGRPGEARVPRL